MAAVADLTLAELGAQILDPTLKTYVQAMAALPGTVGMAEFFAKLLSAAHVAQSVKNTAANAVTPLVVGEALAAYNSPTTGTVVTDATTGLMSFATTASVNFISTASLDLTIPIYT